MPNCVVPGKNYIHIHCKVTRNSEGKGGGGSKAKVLKGIYKLDWNF